MSRLVTLTASPSVNSYSSESSSISSLFSDLELIVERGLQRNADGLPVFVDYGVVGNLISMLQYACSRRCVMRPAIQQMATITQSELYITYIAYARL